MSTLKEWRCCVMAVRAAVLWRGQPLRVCPRNGSAEGKSGQTGERVMTGDGSGGMVNGRQKARRENWVNVLLKL
ncbi:hypothetical protein [Salmonella enterica]|uniref:hypothetical protein n=1 Tax=Salmonella enterica TaxID=28901 RepID=UPI001600CB45|nr:hypothetical protein [Salmonella enterica]